MPNCNAFSTEWLLLLAVTLLVLSIPGVCVNSEKMIRLILIFFVLYSLSLQTIEYQLIAMQPSSTIDVILSNLAIAGR